ncbi:ribonuclease P protein component [Candidatus Saccharibacteria bacterium]|nr:ribonuclease P protein component [Candidatus Saccharibacteria bacterium]
MISQKYRFHSRGGVQFVLSKGTRVRGKRMGLTFLMDTGRRASRVAVVVSKKVAKSAVKRNRIRRRVFEVVRLSVLPKLALSHDLIFFVQDSHVAEMAHGELVREMVDLVERAGL